MGRLRQRITDPGLLALILKYLEAKVKKITKRTRGHSPKSVIEELQSYLRGAAA